MTHEFLNFVTLYASFLAPDMPVSERFSLLKEAREEVAPLIEGIVYPQAHETRAWEYVTWKLGFKLSKPTWFIT